MEEFNTISKATQELDIIETFIAKVCKRAEDIMMITGKLEEAHYSAMIEEFKILKEKIEYRKAIIKMRFE